MIKRFVKNVLFAVVAYVVFMFSFALFVTACTEDKDDDVVEVKKETTYTLEHYGSPMPPCKDIYIFEFDAKGYVVARKYTAILGVGSSITYTASTNATRIEVFLRIEDKYYFGDGGGRLIQGEDNPNLPLFTEEITEAEYQRGISQ